MNWTQRLLLWGCIIWLMYWCAQAVNVDEKRLAAIAMITIGIAFVLGLLADCRSCAW